MVWIQVGKGGGGLGVQEVISTLSLCLLGLSENYLGVLMNEWPKTPFAYEESFLTTLKPRSRGVKKYVVNPLTLCDGSFCFV